MLRIAGYHSLEESIPISYQGLYFTDRQSHSEGWVSYQRLHLLTDSPEGWVSHQGLQILTDSLTVKGEYPSRNYTYWQTALQWRVSIPAGITLTDRQSHSEGWVSHQGLQLLTHSLTVKGEYPSRDYTYWQTVSQWRMSIPPGITLTDRQPHSEGWVCH